MEQQAIDLYDRMNNPIEAIEKLGAFFAKSGMFGCERVEQGAILAAACMAEKKSPLEITRKYHLLDGRLSMKSEAMLAEFKARGGKHRIVSRSPDCAAIELTSDGQTQTFSLTWEEAQAEPFPFGNGGKLKKNWATPRARMQTMWARVVSDGVRAMAPEIVTGTYTPEEIEDFGDVTAPKELLKAEPKAAKPEPKAEPKPLNTPPPPAPEVERPEPIDVEPIIGLVTKAEAVNGKLTIPTIQTLQHVIGDHAVTAEGWLKAKGHIKESFADMPVHVAQKIIDAPAKFIQAIGGAK